MLKILIIANDVGNSVIKWHEDNRGVINGLPQKLQNKVFHEVKALSDRQVSRIEYEEHQFVLTQNAREYTIVPCPEFLKGASTTILIETIQLLHWYVGPHLYARDPDRLGGPIICTECHRSQRRGYFNGYCEFAGCPSHAKWAEIVEGYEAPKIPSGNLFEVFAKVVQGPQNKKTAITEPNLGDEPNEWIQKG